MTLNLHCFFRQFVPAESPNYEHGFLLKIVCAMSLKFKRSTLNHSVNIRNIIIFSPVSLNFYNFLDFKFSVAFIKVFDWICIRCICNYKKIPIKLGIRIDDLKVIF